MVKNVERFGVFLPSYVWEGDGPERARGIKDFARKVEDLGFDSIFITDHMLAAKDFYSVSFLEPVSALSVVVGATERVRVGTSIMILPLRNPVMLAKQLATLQFLSDNRVILGAGTGWYPPEFESVGVKKSERGKRTDEILDICYALWEGKPVTYDGTYYQIKDVQIEPLPSQPPTLWVGGGSQLASDKSPDLPRFAEAVKQRVLRGDGWIPRPTAPPEDIARDWQELQQHFRDAGRDPSECVVAHENFMHLVVTDDPQEARRQQHEAFLRVMSTDRGAEYLEQVYLFGTPDEIVESLQKRVDAGVEYFMLHTMTPDPDQLDLWLTEIVPHVEFPNEG